MANRSESFIALMLLLSALLKFAQFLVKRQLIEKNYYFSLVEGGKKLRWLKQQPISYATTIKNDTNYTSVTQFQFMFSLRLSLAMSLFLSLSLCLCPPLSLSILLWCSFRFSHWPPFLSTCSMECLRFTLQLLDWVKNIFIKAISFSLVQHSLAHSEFLPFFVTFSHLLFCYFVKRSSSLLLYGMTTQSTVFCFLFVRNSQFVVVFFSLLFSIEFSM